jgi:hypothetical protein
MNKNRTYYIPNGSCYIEILKIRYASMEYIKAHVRWYSRPGGSFMVEERSLKIPRECFTFWKLLGDKVENG